MSATGEQLTNAQVWEAAAQAIDRFMHKRGMGACICEAREIHAVADEIERLRAENAALREEHARMLGAMKAATGYMLELQNHAAWTCLESTIAAIDAARKAS